MPDLLTEMRSLDPHCRGLLVRAYQDDPIVADVLAKWRDVPSNPVNFASALAVAISMLSRKNAELRKRLLQYEEPVP